MISTYLSSVPEFPMDSNASQSYAPLAYSAASLLAALWCTTVLLSRRRHGRLPGPTGLPLVGSLPFLAPDLHAYFACLSKVYGPIFQLKLGSKVGVVVSSPTLAREVLRDQDTVFANRDVLAVARVLTYDAQDIGWNSTGPTLRMLRRVCAREMLGPASLEAVYGLRRREVRAAVRHLAASAGSPADVGAHMFATVMSIITGVLWGGTVEGAAAGGEFRKLVREIIELLGAPNVSDFFPALARFDLQGLQRRIGRMFARFDRIFDSIIEQQKEDGGEGVKDFLQYMLKLEAEGGDPMTPFTMIHVKALLMDMVVGGTDTTSNTIEWAMAEMMQKPEIMRKAQKELDEIVGTNAVVEESHIPKLQYLSLVIKEVLRLHPALPLLVPHCPSSSCTIGGYTVLEGSRVFVNVWGIHRDPSIWEDPLEFKPERFLSTDRKWDFTGNDFTYFPFGSGRRICVGISMAEKMVSYSLASLLHSFEWKLEEGVNLNLEEKFGIVLKKAKPLIAIPTPRLANHELYL